MGEMAMMADALGELKGLRVLVTGDTGFKGSWLCAWLLRLGARVSGLALPPEGEPPLFDLLRLRDRIDHHDADIRDLDQVRAVFDKVQPDLVIHLAAQALVLKSYADPKTTFDTNVGGSVNILEAVRATASIRALVYITSDKCYLNKEWVWGYRENDELGGVDPYSVSKACAEHVFSSYQQCYLERRADFAAASTRAGNVIGGGDWAANRIVPDCIRALREGRPIILRNPGATRPWQHVLEPVGGYLLLAAALLRRGHALDGAYNFGPAADVVRPVRDLAQAAIGIWGAGELVIEPNPNAPHEAGLLQLSSDKAKGVLGWRPTWSFDECIAHTVGWYRQVHDGADPVAVTEAQINDFMEKMP